MQEIWIAGLTLNFPAFFTFAERRLVSRQKAVVGRDDDETRFDRMQATQGFWSKRTPLLLLTLFLAAMLGAGASTRDLKPQEARIVAPVDAMIVPPPGGPAIVNVVSTTFSNAVRQDLSLATQARSIGENKITIVKFVSAGGDGSGAARHSVYRDQLDRRGFGGLPGSGRWLGKSEHGMTGFSAHGGQYGREQAGMLSEGGDIFLLGMGASVRICDLAENMIRLARPPVVDRAPRLVELT